MARRSFSRRTAAEDPCLGDTPVTDIGRSIALRVNERAPPAGARGGASRPALVPARGPLRRRLRPMRAQGPAGRGARRPSRGGPRAPPAPTDAGRGVLRRSAAALAGSSSATGSGIVRMWRTGESSGNSTGVSPRIAPIQIASWTPIVVARMPPTMPPIGIVPHTRNRIVAFIRPCIRGGQIACR